MQCNSSYQVGLKIYLQINYITHLKYFQEQEKICIKKAQPRWLCFIYVYFLFILRIDVNVSIFEGHTVWHESAFEQPAEKCFLYSFKSCEDSFAD